MAYATVEDLEARWRELSESESAMAATLLEDAAAYIDALKTFDALDPETESLLRMVSCNMVRRAMSSAASSAFGIDSATSTMGEFSQHVQFANPSGDMYVTKAERRLLGVSSTALGSIRPTIAPKKVRQRWR